MRVLGLITQQGAVPFTIAAESRPRSQRFIIELARLPDHAASSLLAKVEASVTIRSAKLTRATRGSRSST